MNAPEDRDAALLCVGGRQHAFVTTVWEQNGAESFWALELMCPTCGTTTNREGDTGDWSWHPPDE